MSDKDPKSKTRPYIYDVAIPLLAQRIKAEKDLFACAANRHTQPVCDYLGGLSFPCLPLTYTETKKPDAIYDENLWVLCQFGDYQPEKLVLDLWSFQESPDNRPFEALRPKKTPLNISLRHFKPYTRHAHMALGPIFTQELKLPPVQHPVFPAVIEMMAKKGSTFPSFTFQRAKAFHEVAASYPERPLWLWETLVRPAPVLPS
jgi:hypothetical protein